MNVNPLPPPPEHSLVEQVLALQRAGAAAVLLGYTGEAGREV